MNPTIICFCLCWSPIGRYFCLGLLLQIWLCFLFRMLVLDLSYRFLFGMIVYNARLGSLFRFGFLFGFRVYVRLALGGV
jgi:hypothetical protein